MHKSYMNMRLAETHILFQQNENIWLAMSVTVLQRCS